MKYNNDVLQAAIDAACEETAKGPFRPMCAELALRAKDNPHEANSRLALAKAFLAALPPAKPQYDTLNFVPFNQETLQIIGRLSKSQGLEPTQILKNALEHYQTAVNALLPAALPPAEKAKADSAPRPSLSRLRPLTEAGPVPAGAVRFTGYLDMPDVWVIGSNNEIEEDTHFADILLHPEQKSDPYAEFKAAHAAGKTIQLNCGDTGEPEWEDVPDPAFLDTPDRYRIKPEPETFQSDDKVKTPRTDAAKFRIGDSNHFAVHVMHVEQLETELNEAHKEIEKLRKIIRDEYPEDQAEELIESCKKKK